MIIVKPNWVIHTDDKKKKVPILSVDIHPDGTRFATAGLDFKIKIWNTVPLRDASADENPSVPKSLCTLCRHDGAVNCIRWSNGSGTYLASGSDDKVVMIWQHIQTEGVVQNSAFGSAQTDGAPIIENWTCVQRLVGHNGDVMDLAWSHDNRYIATCGLDHFICIWDTQTWQLVQKLHGCQSFIKGVTWDPVGKYLASQSDDGQVRIWRVADWKIEKVVTGAFESAVGGTAFFCRLSWSPDGGSVATAQAFNNGLPVSAVLNRDQWDASLARSLVGHHGAIVVARFNPVIFDVGAMSAVCAIGSKDDSLSVWSSAQPRPIAVAKSLFEQSVLDIAWSRDGHFLLASSYDGTIACLEFSKEELGVAVPNHDVEKLLEKYGSKRRDVVLAETPEQLNFEKAKPKIISSSLSSSSSSSSLKKDQTGNEIKTIPFQSESRTKDGKKRITPQLVRSFNESAPTVQTNINENVPMEDPDMDRLMHDAYHKIAQISSLPAPPPINHQEIRLDFANIRDHEVSSFDVDKEFKLPRPKSSENLSKEFTEATSVFQEPRKCILTAEQTSFGAQISLQMAGQTVWRDTLPGCKVTFLAGNINVFYAIATDNHFIYIYSAKGRRLFPCWVMKAPIHRLDVDGQLLSVVLCDGTFSLYHLGEQTCLHDQLNIPIKGNDCVRYVVIHQNHIPVIFLMKETLMYHHALRTWMQVTDASSPYAAVGMNQMQSGKVLAALQQTVKAQPVAVNAAVSAQCTVAHLEHQCALALALNSKEDYKLWARMYVKRLSEMKCEDKLRELYEKWIKDEAGRQQLKEMLPVMASERSLQRLVQEYMDILQ